MDLQLEANGTSYLPLLTRPRTGTKWRHAQKKFLETKNNNDCDLVQLRWSAIFLPVSRQTSCACMDLSIPIRREQGPEESVGTVADILDNFRGESLSGCLPSLPSYTLSCPRRQATLAAATDYNGTAEEVPQILL